MSLTRGSLKGGQSFPSTRTGVTYCLVPVTSPTPPHDAPCAVWRRVVLLLLGGLCVHKRCHGRSVFSSSRRQVSIIEHHELVSPIGIIDPQSILYSSVYGVSVSSPQYRLAGVAPLVLSQPRVASIVCRTSLNLTISSLRPNFRTVTPVSPSRPPPASSLSILSSYSRTVYDFIASYTARLFSPPLASVARLVSVNHGLGHLQSCLVHPRHPFCACILQLHTPFF